VSNLFVHLPLELFIYNPITSTSITTFYLPLAPFFVTCTCHAHRAHFPCALIELRMVSTFYTLFFLFLLHHFNLCTLIVCCTIPISCMYSNSYYALSFSIMFICVALAWCSFGFNCFKDDSTLTSLANKTRCILILLYHP
jgi:hypothetical protein